MAPFQIVLPYQRSVFELFYMDWYPSYFQVLRVVRALLTFGYIGIAQLQPWMTSILPLMDGTNDLPSITARRKSVMKGMATCSHKAKQKK